ncbi:MAG: hypothetical protein WD751_03700 [Anaerolineales bacterium]
MRLGKKWIVLLATLALLLVAAVPAMAAPRFDTVNVNVENRTGSSVQLKFNGDGDNPAFFVGAEQTLAVEMVPGMYSYRYQACGRTNIGTFIAGSGEPTLVLKKCAGLALSNIVIDNQTGSPFIVTLSGTGGLYGFWVPPGGITVSLPAGGYAFTANACGTSSGTLKASASLDQPLIWTWTCDGVTLAAD